MAHERLLSNDHAVLPDGAACRTTCHNPVSLPLPPIRSSRLQRSNSPAWSSDTDESILPSLPPPIRRRGSDSTAPQNHETPLPPLLPSIRCRGPPANRIFKYCLEPPAGGDSRPHEAVGDFPWRPHSGGVSHLPRQSLGGVQSLNAFSRRHAKPSTKPCGTKEGSSADLLSVGAVRRIEVVGLCQLWESV